MLRNLSWPTYFMVVLIILMGLSFRLYYHHDRHIIRDFLYFVSSKDDSNQPFIADKGFLLTIFSIKHTLENRFNV